MNLYIDGCSYSSYLWPTWADLLTKHYSKNDAVNLALCGAGNEKIFFNLVHNAKQFIPGTTKVILQWSSYPRIDYWKTPLQWNTDGNRYYPGDFVERNKDWWSDEYLQFKVYYYVELAEKLLTDMGVEFYFMTMDNWSLHNTAVSRKLKLDWNRIINHQQMLIHDMTNFTKSDFKYTYQSPWQDKAYLDGHPSINSHIRIARFVNEKCLGIELDEKLIEQYHLLHDNILHCNTLDDVNNVVKRSLK